MPIRDSQGKVEYDDFLNGHKMLNSAWILIELTRINSKYLTFRKNIFDPKKLSGGHVQLKMINITGKMHLFGFLIEYWFAYQ